MNCNRVLFVLRKNLSLALSCKWMVEHLIYEEGERETREATVNNFCFNFARVFSLRPFKKCRLS